MPWGVFLRSTILLLRLKHTLKSRQGFLHTPLHPMELDSFVTIVFQNPVVALSDVIKYNCPLYKVFKSLSTSGKNPIKLDVNEVVSTGSQNSSTPFQYVKGMSFYFSVPHDRTDSYKDSIFSDILDSPPPVGNTAVFFYFYPFPHHLCTP